MEKTDMDVLLNNLVTIGKSMKLRYKEGVRDKKIYAALADTIHMEVNEEVKEEDSIIKQFRQHMDNKKNLALSYPSNPVTLAMFGLEYMKNRLWDAINELGIGNLHELYVKRNSFVAEINLHLGIHKSEKESVEEYKERKRKFFDNTLYEYHAFDRTNTMHIINNDKNVAQLLSDFSALFDIRMYELSVKDGDIWSIVIRATDIHIPEAAKEIEASNDADLELAMKTIDDMLESISLYKSISNAFNDMEDLVANYYFIICSKFGCENDFTKKYDEMNKKNRIANMKITDLVNQIGSSITPKEVIENAGMVIERFDEKISKELHSHLDIRFSCWGLYADMTFHYNDLFECGKGSRFEAFRFYVTDDEFIIPETKLEYMQDILADEYGISISNVDIQYTYNHLAIKNIKCNVSSPMKLIEMYMLED